jgi:hypothetical protein
MRQLKLKVHVQIAIVALFAFLALIPCQAQAMNMSYGDWEMDGFLRNNTGVWTENWDAAPNNDPLATCRNWLRLNLNGKISDTLKLKAEVLGVYETEYSRERGGGIPANEYNSFDFREMRLDWRPAMGHNLRIGKQIVNWGESISARIGDVVNPVDGRFDLGFTNLEDTRMPIWMIRGLHQISSIGTSFDWIFSPYLEPDRYRVARTLAWGPANFLADGTWLGTAAMRWTPSPDYRFFGANGKQYGANQVLTINTNTYSSFVSAPVLWAPLNTIYTQLPAGVDLGPALGLPWPLVTPTAGYYLLGAPNIYRMDYPDSSLKDSRYGFKTSSTIGGFQTGVYFWRAHVHTPPVFYKTPGTNNFKMVYNRQNVYGFYANKNYDFGVLRMDVAYRPNMEFQTVDQVKHPNLVCQEDNLKVQVGYNKDFMMRSLNPDQTFGLIAEYVGDYLVSGDSDGALFAFPWYIKKPRDSHEFMVSLGTNYNFGMYAPNLTVIYNLRNNGLVQPSFTYSPDWMNRKWSFKLQYTNVFADNSLDYVYGLYQDKDNVVLTTQFSFP